MSKRPLQRRPRSGLTGVLFVFCLAALLAGLGFDVAGEARTSFWIGAQPGAAAMIGVAAVVFAVVAARLAQILFTRRGGP
jgi:hypothetical protein